MDLDQLLLILEPARFQQFVALLEAPAGPNPGLARLLAVRPPWDADTEPGRFDG